MIKKIMSGNEIRATYPVMRQLRPHLTEQQYIECIRTQQNSDHYELAALIDDGNVHCIAGYRIVHNLACGRFLYVDDLVTDKDYRSRDNGKQMMEWLLREARDKKCTALHLDCGVQRHGAHRFYFRERLNITGYHFALKV